MRRAKYPNSAKNGDKRVRSPDDLIRNLCEWRAKENSLHQQQLVRFMAGSRIQSFDSPNTL